MEYSSRPIDHPEVKQLFIKLLASLFEESSRGALMIVISHLDDGLTGLLSAVLPNEMTKNERKRLINYPGHLSSFSSKIELAYAFRLIGRPLYNSLNSIRKIRNEAAHSSLPIDLEELNQKMENVYDLGVGVVSAVKKMAADAMLTFKFQGLDQMFENLGLSVEDRREMMKATVEDKEVMDSLRKQLPFWELLYGTSIIYWMIVSAKDEISELAKDGKLWTKIHSNPSDHDTDISK